VYFTYCFGVLVIMIMMTQMFLNTLLPNAQLLTDIVSGRLLTWSITHFV